MTNQGRSFLESTYNRTETETMTDKLSFFSPTEIETTGKYSMENISMDVP